MKKIFNFKSTLAAVAILSSIFSFAQDVVETPAVIDRPIYEDLGVSSTTLFIIMLSLTIILLFALISVSKSTANVLKFKNSKKAGLVILGMLSTTAFGAETETASNFINFSDNAFWAFLILDVILVMVILYFTGLMKGALKEFSAKGEKSSNFFSQFNKSMTNAVEIEDEETILLDHDYDGIHELDNDLPPWWKYGFYITIVWGVIYFPYYHIFNTDGLQEGEYITEMADGEREAAAFKAANPNMVNEDNVELLTDAASLAKGKEVYEANCVACHLNNGGGSIGPNLTDKYWIYDGDIKGVFHTVAEGANNGMIAWKDMISPDKIQAVSSYVISMTPVEGGKDAQGENIFE